MVGEGMGYVGGHLLFRGAKCHNAITVGRGAAWEAGREVLWICVMGS
jgi:hypothetical protein